MKTRVKRSTDLSEDELREAIWHYLKSKCDEPMPEKYTDLALTDFPVSSVEVVWFLTREAT